MDYRNGHIYIDDSWRCTDPDNYQFCKKLSNTEYSYCQLANDGLKKEIETLEAKNHSFDVKEYLNNKETNLNDWYCGDINVNDYDADEIGEVLSAYDGILDNCKGNEALTNQLICECIFETYMLTDFAND